MTTRDSFIKRFGDPTWTGTVTVKQLHAELYRVTVQRDQLIGLVVRALEQCTTDENSKWFEDALRIMVPDTNCARPWQLMPPEIMVPPEMHNGNTTDVLFPGRLKDEVQPPECRKGKK